jgi:hypothetical protein
MNQAASFGLLGVGGLAVVKALTGASWADVVRGKPGPVASTGASLASTGVAGAGAAIAGTAAKAGTAAAPAAGSSGSYSKAQLESLWTQYGGNPAHAGLAAAVALAESGGNPHSTDDDGNGSVDRGLWQINSVHGAQSTYDIAGNVKAAIAISDNGANFGPWVTFQTGAYRKFL